MWSPEILVEMQLAVEDYFVILHYKWDFFLGMQSEYFKDNDNWCTHINNDIDGW